MTERIKCKIKLKLNKGNERMKCKTISLKKYLPKAKSPNDYRYIHYQDPSFQDNFNGVVLRKDYQISNLLLRRLRDKSTPSLKKTSSSKFYSPNQLFISNKDKKLSMSSSRFFDTFRPHPDDSFYSEQFQRDWTIRGNANQHSILLPSIKRDNKFFVNQYNINSSLPFIPKLLFNGNCNVNEGLIHNEFLISKFSFFSKY